MKLQNISKCVKLIGLIARFTNRFSVLRWESSILKNKSARQMFLFTFLLKEEYQFCSISWEERNTLEKPFEPHQSQATWRLWGGQSVKRNFWNIRVKMITLISVDISLILKSSDYIYWFPKKNILKSNSLISLGRPT